ncbi:MAG: hypothetical protein JW889_15480 [Verrucomicrobia bacterium]|nr:hypothetical protein [Verrucomicrobiota bacterium]
MRLGVSRPDAPELREAVEREDLAKEAHPVQLVGALLVSGSVVALAALVTFGFYGIRASLLSVVLFACGVTVYAVVGWVVARRSTLEPFTMLGRLGQFSPTMHVTTRLWLLWLLLCPGRLMALGAIGAYRFVCARRRLRELQERARSGFPTHRLGT